MKKINERGSVFKRYADLVVGVPVLLLLVIYRRAFFKKKKIEKPESICVLCFGAIGDMLLVTGMLNSIKRQWPKCRIVLIASTSNGVALPLVENVCSSGAFDIWDFSSLLRFIRNKSPDILIDTSQWARYGAVISALSNAQTLVGFKTEGQFRSLCYDHRVDHRDSVHELDNFQALARSIGVENACLPSIKHVKVCDDISDNSEYLVFHLWPSGYKSHLKEWPCDQWAALVKKCVEAGFRVVFTGGGGDGRKTKDFIEFCKGRFSVDDSKIENLAGSIDIKELVNILLKAKAVVAVNTGIMHLAAILDVKTIALHGPTNPSRWGPVGQNSISVVPEKGEFGYLNLGFEYRHGKGDGLINLNLRQVESALRSLGVVLA